MDASSAQLRHDIQESVIKSLRTRRPLLHHLNADTSWLLQIPARHNERHWFNILIDPWLSGSQSDVASWFSQQSHATESKVNSITLVEELAREIENLTDDLYLGENRIRNDHQDLNNGDSFIDAVAISHEFTDHCHKETLLEVPASVPVFASQKAASLIRSWKHFLTVEETPPFPGRSLDWHDVSLSPLPAWLGIARLTSESDALYYHSALMIVFTCDPISQDRGRDSSAEAILYTPHGINAADLKVVANASPTIETLAFLHGLHDVSIGSFGSAAQQLNLGAYNGLEAQRLLGSKYWIGTHDEVKNGGGLISWFLNRKVITVKEALDLESKSATGLDKVLEDVNFASVANGESIMLI